MTRIITITSATGGVGKTCIAVSLAVRLAGHGQRVCLLDAGGGTTGAAQLLGLVPRYTLCDLLQTGVALDEVIIRDCQGFDLVPANADSDSFATLTTSQLSELASVLTQLEGYHCILIDASSGTGSGAQAFALAGSETILVVTPQPAVLGDSYALLRQFHDGRTAAHVHLVVNKADNQTVGEQFYTKFKEVAGFYLGQDVPLLGVVGAPGDRQDIEQMANRLLTDRNRVSGLELKEFARRFLLASRLSPACDRQTEPDDVRPVPDSDALQTQMEGLASRVDELITEVETLRAAASRRSGVINFPQADHKTSHSHCAEICFAVQTPSEEVTVQGETVSIYHMQRSNGDTQRFACHSLDDDIQEPEPKSTSS